MIKMHFVDGDEKPKKGSTVTSLCGKQLPFDQAQMDETTKIYFKDGDTCADCLKVHRDTPPHKRKARMYPFVERMVDDG